MSNDRYVPTKLRTAVPIDTVIQSSQYGLYAVAILLPSVVNGMSRRQTPLVVSGVSVFPPPGSLNEHVPKRMDL